MLGFDRARVEKILNQFFEMELDGSESSYRFYKEDNSVCLLGTGGTSFVYEMYDVQNPDKHYALKIVGFNGSISDPDEIRYSLKVQYELSRQCENIGNIIDLWTIKCIFDEDENLVDLIDVTCDGFEESDGVTLQMILLNKMDEIISKDKYGNVRLLRDDLKTESGVVEFARQIGNALLTIHSNGFLHRDIKLENIFWDQETSSYKLGDFGVVKYVEDGGAETVLFTDGYGAPEIEKRLSDSYGMTADIYSFGITLYLLLNELKFPASDSYHANLIQYEKDFIPPAPAKASVTMTRILRRMISYRPEERIRSVEEVIWEINEAEKLRNDENVSQWDETELYDELKTETFDESTEVIENTETVGAASGMEKSDRENTGETKLTREEKIKRARKNEEIYRRSSFWRFIWSSIMFFFLFKAFSRDVSHMSEWKLWVLPALLLAESALQYFKEYDFEFGMIILAIALASLVTGQTDVPQIVMVPVVLLGVSTITAGCAMGVAAWILQMHTGKWGWLDILSKLDLGWLAIVGIVSMSYSYVLFRKRFNRDQKISEKIWLWTVDNIWIVLIAVGIVMLFRKMLWKMSIPPIIEKLHLIRIGFGIFVSECCVLAWDDLPELEEGEEVVFEDESLD